jgi:uncharacterized protein YodC (DUF2158 family)
MAEQEELKTGDVVYLNSSPNLLMTVGRIDDNEVATCVWFHDYEVREETFYVKTLTKTKVNL